MIDITKLITEHIAVFNQLDGIKEQIINSSELLKNTLKKGKKILVCGNGGSAADSQHFAAELTGHYQKERAPLAAISLTTDTSALTAIANDYSYEDIFSRQLQALGQIGDTLIAISTSGNSKNIIKAMQTAYDLKINVIVLTGRDGGEMARICQNSKHIICVPHPSTSRIQEAHIFILHYFCEVLDS